MDWAILIVLVVILALLISIKRDITDNHNRVLSELHQFRTRQTNIARERSSRRTPHVDAHAKTTVRDTDDLPLTGRMSQGVMRKKRIVNDGVDTDS